MSKPIVIAHHLVWTTYGHWLPNDPRGSGSKLVNSGSLAELGELHFGRRKRQPQRKVVREFYDRAEPLLRFPLLTLSESAVAATALGFADCIEEQNYTCYACAIMPDHVHLVIRKHKHSAEEMIDNLQQQSRERLVEERQRGLFHPVWCDGGWKRFLDRPSAVRTVIRYVESNPLEIGEPLQKWPFVAGYDNWPLHPGHSPNSPYASRLRATGEAASG